MSRNLGPALLDHLESKRATMTAGEYAARRAEIEELIRTGRAVELTPWERVLRVLLPIFGTLVGFAVGGAIITAGGSRFVGWLLIFGCIIVSVLTARRIGLRR